jgi:hypothetical protein
MDDIVMKIILVSAGNFQEYVLDNIKNLLQHKNTDITLITEREFFHKVADYPQVELVDCKELLSEEVLFYYNHSMLDRNFRDGFWLYCSLRLFYVYEYIKRNNLTNVIHIENDNLVYIDLELLRDKFVLEKVYVTCDSETRVIPGIIYIPNEEVLYNILKNYNIGKNDMENLGSSVIREYIEELPIINGAGSKYNKNYEKFGCIFDGAAMGQYLYGIDPRNKSGNTRGFINETCVVKYNMYNFVWKRENGLVCPYLLVEDECVKIINLHIHSKELQDVLKVEPTV